MGITKKIAVYNPYFDSLGGGERYTATFIKSALDLGHSVDVWWPVNISAEIKKRFNIDISKANFVKRNSTFDYDLIFWVSDGSIPTSLAKKTLIHLQFPFKNIGGKKIHNLFKSRFYTFIVNSKFTKKYIDDEFKVDSKVIYPPINTDLFEAGSKKKQILYVSRFSALTQKKGHEVLIKSFKKIAHQLPGWNLVLAGGTNVGVEESDLLKLQKMSVGYKIQFVLNPDFSHLQTLYSQSSIFCSPSGYGVDEVEYPMQVEHFGITVVEAMASGCVPVVTNLGGHKEIITNDVDGFLWNTPHDLENILTTLSSKPDLLKHISQAAIQKSTMFSEQKFKDNFSKFL